MLSYYEKLVDYWKAGKLVELYKYFNQWKREGLLSQEEIQKLEKDYIPELGELFIQQCMEDPKILHRVCQTVKTAKGWDDKTFCEKVGIDQEDFFGIMKQSPPKRKIRKITLKVISIFLGEE